MCLFEKKRFDTHILDNQILDTIFSGLIFRQSRQMPLKPLDIDTSIISRNSFRLKMIPLKILKLFSECRYRRRLSRRVLCLINTYYT